MMLERFNLGRMRREKRAYAQQKLLHVQEEKPALAQIANQFGPFTGSKTRIAWQSQCTSF